MKPPLGSADQAAAPDSETARSGRAERLAALAAEQELDALIVGDLVRPGDSGPDAIANLRWLTGFSGTSGVAVIGAERRLFITDFRYVERAEREVDPAFERVVAAQRLLPELVTHLGGRVGYDDALTSVASLKKLEESAPDDVELVAVTGLVERLRAVKDEAEVAAIAAAAELADEVFRWALERGLGGRTERDVARAAQARMRELGAEPSFPPIVGAGENGALPHGEPSEREIREGELVVFDMGAILDGYCSDCTRTYAVGEVGDAEREAYELVRRAQTEALEAIRPGLSGRDADEVARALIREGGHSLNHGLGHGVGLEVHEAPRLGQLSEDVLEEGAVVTVEPGVYLAGRFGIRIEDLVVVTGDGHRNLSGLPKELAVVE